MSEVPHAVPSIWPLGQGVVLSSHALHPEGEGGFYFLRAVRDDLVGSAGEPSSFDVWDACAGAPTLALHFYDEAAVMRTIASLEDLRAAIARAKGDRG